MKPLLIVLAISLSMVYAGQGKVLIESSKQDAYIYVDGKKKAMTGTKPTVISLEEGDHTIEVKKADEEWIYSGKKDIFIGADTETQIYVSTDRTPTNARQMRLAKEKQERDVKEAKRKAFEARLTKTAFGGVETDEFNTILENGEDIVIAGRTYSYGRGASDVWIIKRTKSGEKVWEKTFGGGKHDRMDSFIKLADGNYLFVGTNESKSTDKNVWVVKLSKSGKIISEKFYYVKNLYEIADVVEGDNRDIIVLGKINIEGKGIFDSTSIPFAFATSKNGKKIWYESYMKKGYPNNIIKSKNGYVITGTFARGDLLKGTSRQDGLIFKINSKGKRLWTRKLSSDVKTGYSIDGIAETKNGDFYFTGFGYGRKTIQPMVGKISHDGKLLWKKIYEKPNIKYGHGYAIEAMDDNHFVIAGDVTYEGKEYGDLNVFMINSEGEELWQKSYGGKRCEQCRAMSIDPLNGDVYVAGFTYSFGEFDKDNEQNGWFLALDKNGELK